jgi:hypothetical protein
VEWQRSFLSDQTRVLLYWVGQDSNISKGEASTAASPSAEAQDLAHDGAQVPEARELLAAQALAVQVVGPLSEGPLLRAWRARTADQHGVALLVFRAEIADAERERFVAAAERIRNLPQPLPGVLRVLAVAPSKEAVLTELWTIGSSKELAGLAWSARRRLDFVRRVALALDSVHRAGIVHGCLCEENVLLGDTLEPIVAEAGSISVAALAGPWAGSYVAFAAPEVLEGATPDVRSDVFSIGRLLQHVLRGDDVPAIGEVVAKCLAPAPFGRYASASALAAAIGAAASELPMVEAAVQPAAAPRPPPSPAAHADRAPPFFEKEKATPIVPPSWLAPIGVAVLLAAVTLAFVVGGASSPLRGGLAVALFAGAAMVSWGLRLGPPTSVALRTGFALACGALALVIDPLDFGYRIAAAHAMHGDPASRREAIAQVVRLGRDFRGLSLASVDLSGLDLRGADLRGVDLSGADLSHANLWGAMLEGAAFGGANVSDADFQGTDPGVARDFDLAQCNAGTRLPNPWHCALPSSAGAGRPSKADARSP